MHCDIKEPNVMISRDADWNEPNVVVIDFGLARDFKKGSTGVMGTPGYMPPEVWTHGVWTIFGDVFSLGHWANEGPAYCGDLRRESGVLRVWRTKQVGWRNMTKQARRVHQVPGMSLLYLNLVT
ncbi:Putative cysteine-rich receptor-like protein kinase 30 (Cysteine-rich RLK30) [Durusdinium trenchii]|uniref:non-specific serine/threonine protein kinase n=1 Tax=Durusdinium trenchii TaxID=1381693 RepID=A0ABP0H4T2_9DINO